MATEVLVPQSVTLEGTRINVDATANKDNVLTDNASAATATPNGTGGHLSDGHWLYFPAFDIPEGSTLNGIELDVEDILGGNGATVYLAVHGRDDLESNGGKTIIGQYNLQWDSGGGGSYTFGSATDKWPGNLPNLRQLSVGFYFALHFGAVSASTGQDYSFTYAYATIHYTPFIRNQGWREHDVSYQQGEELSMQQGKEPNI